MKMFSITLGNKAGELEVRSTIVGNTAEFQTVINGMVIYQGEYHEARDIAMEIFRFNKENKEKAN